MNEAFKRNMNKIVAPLAVTVGLGAAAYHASAERQAKPEADSPKAMATAIAAGEFGGSESDWGHGTAERVIKDAVEKALSDMDATHSENGLDIDKVIESLPVYDQATNALEMAHYDDVMPDRGDILEVKVDVALDTDNDVSYEVTDATIEDKPNNQE